MQLNIAFSPCPNDTFIFDALVHEKIDTEGLQFNVLLEDVQTLNQWAIEGKVSITKLSYGVLPLVTSQYNLLNSGSALGKGVGPLLISLPSMNGKDLNEMWVAIPGENTTAHLLFSLAYPQITQRVFLQYDEIENFVLSGKGLGVIIHENRFTYAAKGLHKITDLGDYWETTTGAAIPLGGIVIKKDIDEAIQQKVDRLIKKSIEYAYTQYPQLNHYIRCHAQEMSEAVMRQHINLYVNDYSLQLGEEGKKAIHTLMNVYTQLHPGFNANQLQYVKTVNE